MRGGTARRWITRAALVAACSLFFTSQSGASFDHSPISSLVSTCQIQGSGFHSPYAGQTLRTQGVVYADLDMTSRRGFFIQTENCDGNPETSDGLFVYLAARHDIVDSGDRVEVTGLVQEYYGRTELIAAPADIRLLSQSNPLPNPVEPVPPFENRAASGYWETLEGMSVSLADARVVGPTDQDGQTWVVRSDLEIARVYPDDPAGTGEVICADDGGLFEVAPEAVVGDRVLDLAGALDYSGGLYCLQLVRPPSTLHEGPGLEPILEKRLPMQDQGVEGHLPDSGPVLDSFRIATFNLANLFDTVDDPGKQDTVLSASEYQRRLQKRAMAIHAALGEPEILALQEVENEAVLQALLARPEILADYRIQWIEGPDERGIDVAMLVRSDRVQVADFQARQGCTRRVDGFGPDGNRDVQDPQNLVTCDSDGDGRLDGNRLFSRPPLLVHVNVCRVNCAQGASGPADWADIWLIDNHFKSKVEDGDIAQYTLGRRVEEATYVAGLAKEILAIPGANLVILGDLNDFPSSQPIQILSEAGLVDLWRGVEKRERYSYIFQGVSQVLDYSLIHLSLPLSAVGMESVHLNADYPVAYADDPASPIRSSDHDPLLVRIAWLEHFAFLPLVPIQ